MDHDVFLCATCGTSYPPAATPPERCLVCDDARQYLPVGGQRWLTEAELGTRHHDTLTLLEPQLYALHTEPSFAIGQRALLVRTAEGNVLWDCLSVLDAATLAALEQLGGVAAIAISHPHYYTAQRRWSEAFDAPVHLHAADLAWVVDRHARLEPWEGERLPLPGGLTLARAGGHFPGGCLLHWPGGADGRGVLLSGDVLQVVPDRSVVGFMYSFPNYVPLPAWEVEMVANTALGLAFDRIYGAFVGRQILTGGRAAVMRGRDQYLRALRGELPGMRPRPEDGRSSGRG